MHQLSRRAFLKVGLGVFTLAVTSTGLITAAWAADTAVTKYGADSMPGGMVDDPLVFLSIAPDGAVTIMAHRAEMGTGVRISLPMVVADENCIDIKVLVYPTVRALWHALPDRHHLPLLTVEDQERRDTRPHQ